jgi:ribosomal protein S18 acetylase RimI-like enzyme
LSDSLNQKLDNPAWHALTSQQQHFGSGNQLARRFRAEISPIAALYDQHAQPSWEALAEVVGPQKSIGIFCLDRNPLPVGWEMEWRYTFAQMTCNAATFKPPVISDDPTVSIRPLTIDDGAAMVALAQLTQPGPMEIQTVLLGRYLGIFDKSDTLIAMAGERTRFDGAIEVSGVCTHPDHRGKGYGVQLVTLITRQIVKGGDTAFLHARDGNPARYLYEQLGFSDRRTFDIGAMHFLG